MLPKGRMRFPLLDDSDRTICSGEVQTTRSDIRPLPGLSLSWSSDYWRGPRPSGLTGSAVLLLPNKLTLGHRSKGRADSRSDLVEIIPSSVQWRGLSLPP